MILRFAKDERWVEWLDSKMALLINRDGVDPRDYGGKSYDEYVHDRATLRITECLCFQGIDQSRGTISETRRRG
jgi:hypothetical protein